MSDGTNRREFIERASATAAALAFMAGSAAGDLEEIAAETQAPSAKTLEAVRRKNGFPQSWYDDDSKPF